MTKNAVVVLTRGYNDSRKYQSLIKRNISIALHLKDTQNTDILIFHEGNIITTWITTDTRMEINSSVF